MPSYRYRCTKCNAEYEIVHAMDEERHMCEQCKVPDSLVRVPVPIRLGKIEIAKPPAGTLVRKHLQMSKEELERMKRELQQEYRPEKKR